jgi:hypothetical protein
MKRTHFAVLAAAILSLLSIDGRAEEFRIESKVYADNSQTPASESVTLFADSRVYGFQSTPREVTLLDIPRERIVLLDPERKIRTEIPTDMLMAYCEQIRTRAAADSDALARFAAEPKFEETREDADWRRFTSPLMTYRVHTTKPNNPAVVRPWREYSDWTARLITMVHRNSLPPFPSQAINAALAREGLVAVEVERTIGSQGKLGGKPSVWHSKHEIQYRLSGADHRRIEEVGEQLVNFSEVPLARYLSPGDQAKR